MEMLLLLVMDLYKMIALPATLRMATRKEGLSGVQFSVADLDFTWNRPQPMRIVCTIGHGLDHGHFFIHFEPSRV
jgi:hypothetical protein